MSSKPSTSRGTTSGTADDAGARSRRRTGFALGLAGVIAFSGTLPATRAAVVYLDPVFVGLDRALVAAVLAAIVLFATRTPWPARALWPRVATTRRT